MLKRINELLEEEIDFALETTLSTRSYVPFVKKARLSGYKITLLYFWLDSPQTAYDRVAKRVSEGGHNIPIDIIERRYYRGIINLLNLYIPVCDKWFVMNNANQGLKYVDNFIG
ncbi:MAG: hypothetical protein ACHQIM_18585 [Sphingobacteriales bacterium]